MQQTSSGYFTDNPGEQAYICYTHSPQHQTTAVAIRPALAAFALRLEEYEREYGSGAWEETYVWDLYYEAQLAWEDFSHAMTQLSPAETVRAIEQVSLTLMKIAGQINGLYDELERLRGRARGREEVTS